MAIRQLQNNFTTPEQSKRLLELGVPADSADCWYNSTNEHGNVTWFHMGIRYCTQDFPDFPDWSKTWKYGGFFGKKVPYYLPCWSVGRLIWILSNSQGWKPKSVSIPESAINKQIDFLVKSIETRVLLNKFYYWEDKPETLHEIAELVCNRKLRGFFILRNGRRIHSNELRRAEKNSPVTTHIYWLRTEKDDTCNMYDYDMENVYNKSLDVVDFSKLED